MAKTFKEVEEENIARWKKVRENGIATGEIKVTRQTALDFLENEGWLDGEEYENLEEYARAVDKKRNPQLEPVNYHKGDLIDN